MNVDALPSGSLRGDDRPMAVDAHNGSSTTVETVDPCPKAAVSLGLESLPSPDPEGTSAARMVAK